MLQLLEAAVEAVNTPGQVVNLPTVWGSMLEKELEVASAAARKAYATFTAALEDSESRQEAEELHQVGLQCALAV